MKALGYLLYFSFAVVAMVGFAYFGPPQYTQVLTNNAFFRTRLVPVIDRILSASGNEESTVGYITTVKSQVDYRPPSALSPLPARGGERLSQGTIVSSGPRSATLIRLVDDSVISLGENTTLQIELPEGSGKMASIELRVIEGTVMAERAVASNSKIKLKNTLGVVTEVKKTRTIVDSKSKVARTLLAAPVNEDPQRSFEQAFADQEAEASRLRQAELVREKEEAERLARQQQEERRLAEQQARQAEEEAQRRALEEKRLAEIAAQKNKEDERIRRIAERRAKVEAKIAAGRSQIDRSPAGETDLALGLAAKKSGDQDFSQRYMAKSLTNQGYLSNSFGDATRIAVDNMMEGYLQSGDCLTSLDFAKNVLRSYPNDERARAWAKRWSEKLRRYRCYQ